MKIAAFSHHPPVFSAHSGMNPLAKALGAETILYGQMWATARRYSWRMSEALRGWGKRYYGSTWNSLLPVWDERRLAKALRDGPYDVAHFLWGEFASPRRPSLFRRHARLLMGTFHASERRLPVVLAGFKCLHAYDGITLMSDSQRSFFTSAGYPDERIRTILHGVDLHHFRPAAQRAPSDGALRGLMIGTTERDHAMMRRILDQLPDGVLEMTILTAEEQKRYHYEGAIRHAVFPGKLNDAQLLEAYQQADLLVMPMLDCTANNAVLESMACGTPVMVNRVGGIPEYVDPDCNVIVEEQTVDAWVDRLIYWRQNREKLEAMRAGARAWADKFDWREKAGEYITFYGELGHS